MSGKVSASVLLAVSSLVLGVVVGCGSQEPALRMGEERVIFTGTVTQLEPLGQREATVYPVGVDPRFLLTVQVDSIEQNRSSPVTSDEGISFAIHSPARLLGTEDPGGRKFRFKATWVFGPDRYNGFSWLEASPVATAGNR